MADPIDIERLVQSYRTCLMAKIQSREFSSWGGTVTEGFRKTIAEHQILEETYLSQELARRSG